MSDIQAAPYQRSIGLVEADVEANCKIHGVRGILEHSDIEKMIAEYDDEDKQARIFGLFQHLTGLVFKKFNRAVHVIDPIDINRKDYVVVQALDCHPRNPDAILWMAIDKQGRKIIIDELYENFQDIDDMAYQIRAKDEHYRVVRWIADPSAWNTDQHKKDNSSLYTDLYARDLVYEKASKQRHMAINRIKTALNWQYNNGIWVKVPELYFFKSCERTIWEMEHWQWQDWVGKAAQTRSPNEKPVDKDDHMIEDLGRLLLLEEQFTDYQAELYNQPVYHPEWKDNEGSSVSALDDPYS